MYNRVVRSIIKGRPRRVTALRALAKYARPAPFFATAGQCPRSGLGFRLRTE
jgi:hypothetical protein